MKSLLDWVSDRPGVAVIAILSTIFGIFAVCGIYDTVHPCIRSEQYKCFESVCTVYGSQGCVVYSTNESTRTRCLERKL